MILKYLEYCHYSPEQRVKVFSIAIVRKLVFLCFAEFATKQVHSQYTKKQRNMRNNALAFMILLLFLSFLNVAKKLSMFLHLPTVCDNLSLKNALIDQQFRRYLQNQTMRCERKCLYKLLIDIL